MSNTGLNQTTYPAVLGRILARKREEKNLDQGDIADVLGISQPTWSRFERGETPINISMLSRTAQILETSPASILSDADAAVKGLNNIGVTVLPSPPQSKAETALLIVGATLLGLLVAKSLLK